MTTKERCPWCLSSPLMIEYHDTEWGVPLYDDKKLFEFMILDTFQAGLSWAIVLNKRENFRNAFSGFDPEKIALFTEKDIEDLKNNAGIVRNELKIRGSVENAKAYLKVKKEFGSFSKYIWSFVNHKPIINSWIKNTDVPATSYESDQMSKDLKKRGFKFCGSTICYAFMQAAGLINDHLTSCFRYQDLKPGFRFS